MFIIVKIIRYGTKKEIECKYCGSLLQYEPEDIQEFQTKYSWRRYIVCPHCNKEVNIEGSNLCNIN